MRVCTLCGRNASLQVPNSDHSVYVYHILKNQCIRVKPVNRYIWTQAISYPYHLPVHVVRSSTPGLNRSRRDTDPRNHEPLYTLYCVCLY